MVLAFAAALGDFAAHRSDSLLGALGGALGTSALSLSITLGKEGKVISKGEALGWDSDAVSDEEVLQYSLSKRCAQASNEKECSNPHAN